jgi:hypothetical protein
MVQFRYRGRLSVRGNSRNLSFLILLFSICQFSNAQETQIRGFVDTQFGKVTSDTIANKQKDHGFQIGQFDLFITSQINDRFSFLGETVFEWDNSEKDWTVDLERVIIKYAFKDYFNISTGKFHTPFGYWNNAYHHGAVIQPTINRPVIIRFEDNGGYLPIHQVGLQFSGTAIGDKNFGYSLFLSNGQAQGNTGGSRDYTTSAISGSLSFEPVESLQFFVSGYSNTVPKNSYTYQGVKLAEDSRYSLVNCAVAYFGSELPIEFAGEYFSINTRMIGSYNTNAFYAYLGFPINKKLVPYALYNRVSFQQGEEYFIKNDVEEITVGARAIFSPKVVWKLEYTFNHSELSKNSTLAQTQLAIGF